jgi:hypothetical protein
MERLNVRYLRTIGISVPPSGFHLTRAAMLPPQNE